jgi:hypothetical protein
LFDLGLEHGQGFLNHLPDAGVVDVVVDVDQDVAEGMNWVGAVIRRNVSGSLSRMRRNASPMISKFRSEKYGNTSLAR